MRKSLLFSAMLLVASCTVQKEKEFESPSQHRYHAVAEEPVDAETRVYADSKLRVRWNEGDHITIFERNTYNQEFEFLGDTGDTAGDFDPVESSGYHSSGDIEDGHVYAIYPYEKKNKCDYDGKLTVTFPSTQHYKKDSFGVGANVMVAKTNTMDLRFMHVGGYRTFKLYGDGVSVSSVRIESNGPEYLSGRTDVVIGEDGKPEVSFVESTSNSKAVELVCDTPVTLGATDAEAVEFWLVLPPGTLTQGFTVTVTDENGNEFTKSTSNSVEIKSGVKKSMAPFEVEPEPVQPNNVIYYTSSDGSVITPYATNVFGANIVSNEYVDGRGVITFDGRVTSIGERAFLGRQKLTSMIIPDSVLSIGPYAFSSCYYLTEVNLPNSLTIIQENAFAACWKLTGELVLPEGLTRIEDGAFSGCKNLTGELRLPDSLTSVSGFAGCTGFTGNLRLPDGIITIGTGAFSSCSFTGELILPRGLDSIGDSAFEDCRGLTGKLQLPDNLKGIGEYAFHWCEGFTGELVLPESLTYLGQGAFDGCSGFTGDLVIPSNLKYIYAYTFEFCRGFNGELVLPEGLTMIYEEAFAECGFRGELRLPSSLTKLWSGAFKKCSGFSNQYPQGLVIPQGLMSIGEDAFYRCFSWTPVTILSDTPPEGGLNMFSDSVFCIYVPAESVEAYKSAEYWSDYANIIQAIPPETTVIPGFENEDM